MEVHGLGDDLTARRNRAEDLLEQVGLRRDYMVRRPSDLSGGEMQRAVIARALAVEPSVLVLDEPTSSLDVSVKATIANLLLELQATLGLTYVMITHEIDLARHMSDRIAVMYLGQLAEDAPTIEMFGETKALHPYSQLLFAAQPLPDPRQRRFVGIGGEVPSAITPPSGCRFHTRCPIAVENCRMELPVTQTFTTSHQVACHRAAERIDVTLRPGSTATLVFEPGLRDTSLET
jgi:oligopeptide/dipeptide ABC transporter ATP-binding protein